MKGFALILGFVSVEDFKEKCKKLYADKGVPSTDSTISKLAMLLDFNSDGVIDFNEFIEGSRLVREKCKWLHYFVQRSFIQRATVCMSWKR